MRRPRADRRLPPAPDGKPSPSLSGRRWMSLSEVEEYASMCSKTLLKLVSTGEVYGTRKKGKWYIDRDSVDAYFNEDRIILAEMELRRNRH